MKRISLRGWVDPQTRREVRQLTDLPGGVYLSYFRHPTRLPGGLVLAFGKHESGNAVALDAEAGEMIPIRGNVGYLKLREADGRLWYFDSPSREVRYRNLPEGQPVSVAQAPRDVGDPTDVTCDGRYLLLLDTEQDTKAHPIPTTREVQKLWHFFNRPRNGRIWALDLITGTLKKIYETDGFCPLHLDAHPTDPTLLRFCHDMYDAYGQRVWTIRIDGSDLRKIRPQQRGELVTHEFWSADPRYIGYTYQDRRRDPELHELPWAEYFNGPTQFGLSDLSGNEVYLSDPLNHYHTHLFQSRDGNWLCGEGTDGHFFVYAAPLDRHDPRVDFVKLASIHTPYVPFRGNRVNCGFSPDGRWLLYNDTIEGALQVCAVRVS